MADYKYHVTLSDSNGSYFTDDGFDTYKEVKDFYKGYYDKFVGNGIKMWVNVWNNELGRTVRNSVYRRVEA